MADFINFYIAGEGFELIERNKNMKDNRKLFIDKWVEHFMDYFNKSSCIKYY
jgi:hypothetical protein